MKDLIENKEVNLNQPKKLKPVLLPIAKSEDYYNTDILTQPSKHSPKSYIKKLNNEFTTLQEIVSILKNKLFFYESNNFSIEIEENSFFLERVSFLSTELFTIHNDIIKERNEESKKSNQRINELIYENNKYKEIIYELTKQIKSQKEAERVLNEIKKEFKYEK